MSTFVWETNSTVINRLRARSPERDSHSFQLRLTAMLNAADLRPPALPPASILIVRRMGRELPPVRLDWRSVRPPPAWQVAASETLDVLARRAVRPAAGSCAPDGDSVLFRDRSELLACLASDWLDDVLLSRWWWRCLFPREDLVEALLRAWTESPQYIPAAIERLSKTGRAAPFVSRLTPALVTALVKSILRVFALPDLERAIEGLLDETLPVAAEPPGDETLTVDEDVGRACDVRRDDERIAGSMHGVAPPWTLWAPEANIPELKEEHRILLMIALMLRRAPQVTREPAFAARVRQWRQTKPSTMPLRTSTAAALALPRRERAMDATPDDHTIQASESIPEPGTPATCSDSNVSEPILPIPPAQTGMEQGETVSPPVVAFQSEFESVEEHAEEPGTEEKTNGDEPGLAIPIVEMATPPEFCLTQPFDGIEIETEFGGLFYMINVAIYLGFYADFSTPAEPGIDLPIWDFLALAGIELIGDALRDDPVWNLLATLSGRSEREEPGRNYDAQLLSVHMEQTRARLLLALELDQPDDLGEFLLRHGARVQVTDTHLDVFLSLEELPVPIRIARLDRDPGWIPAAGRHIAFHFF